VLHAALLLPTAVLYAALLVLMITREDKWDTPVLFLWPVWFGYAALSASFHAGRKLCHMERSGVGV